MRIKHYFVLPLLLVIFGACESIVMELPENKAKTKYSYDTVVKDICSKKERCVYPYKDSTDYVVFIDGEGYLFVIEKDQKDALASALYLGVGTLTRILPYKNIFAATTSDKSIYLGDKDMHVQRITTGFDQIEFEGNDIVYTEYDTGGTYSSAWSCIKALRLPNNCELKYDSDKESFFCKGEKETFIENHIVTLIDKTSATGGTWFGDRTHFNLYRVAGQLYIKSQSNFTSYKKLLKASEAWDQGRGNDDFYKSF